MATAKVTEKKNPEMDDGLKEKKENFLNGIEKKPQSRKEGPPIYLLVMLLVLGILIGVAIVTMWGPKPQPVDLGNHDNNQSRIPIDLAFRTVPVTVLYSSECKTCRQTNTIEELFKVREIPYTLTKVDANTGEGKKIVERFNVQRVPTVIVDAEKMRFYPATNTSFERNFRLIERAYVIPEVNLNDNYYFASYYLEEVPGYCANADKPVIVQFDDFYNGLNTLGKGKFYGFTNDFNKEVDFKYSYTQTTTSRDANAVLGNIFLMCAGQQGKYLEMEKAMNGIYCNNPFKGDETIITDAEIAGCTSLSNHYGTALSQFELDVAVQRAGLDMNKFKECYENRQVYYNNARQAAEDLEISRVGTFLVDCRETVSLEGLRGAFCARHPEVEACTPLKDIKASQ